MTVFSGFFNSNNNHDRMYNAQHFSRFFDGLICDGVYLNFPDRETDHTKKAFYVKPASSGLAVTVAEGRAWFDGTWIWNDSALTITLDATSNELMQRIDAIVLDIDTSDAGRQNQILVVKGTEDTKVHTVYRPTLLDQPTHKQKPVAFVKVIGGASSISESNITYTVATTDPDSIQAVEGLVEYSNLSKAELKAYIDAADQVIQAQVNTINGYLEAGLPVQYGGTGKKNQYDAFENLANGTSNDTSDVADDDAIIYKKNADSKFYRKAFSKIASYIKGKLSGDKGISYDSSTGVIKLNLVSETSLGKAATFTTATVDGRTYPVALDSNGKPAVYVPWTDENTNNKVTQTNTGTGDTNEYRVIFSNDTGTSSPTDTVRKSPNLTYKPSTGNVAATSFNGVKLVTFTDAGGNTKYGYVDGQYLRSFRQPTGNATAGDVRSGKTFANSSSDSLTGTFAGQEKTVTASRSAQTVTPDSGKWLSKVTVNKYPDASGNYTCGSNNGAASSNDMGATNNYRYVDATAVYTKGKTDGQNVSWYETTALNGGSTGATVQFNCANISTANYSPGTTTSSTAYIMDLYGTILAYLPANSEYTLPRNAETLVLTAVSGRSSVTLRRQTKILHDGT